MAILHTHNVFQLIILSADQIKSGFYVQNTDTHIHPWNQRDRMHNLWVASKAKHCSILRVFNQISSVQLNMYTENLINHCLFKLISVVTGPYSL